MTKHCSRKSGVRRFVLPAALTLLLASCHPLAPVMYIGISLCLLSKTTPPSWSPTDKNIWVNVGTSKFIVNALGVKYLSGEQACFVALKIDTEGVPRKTGVKPFSGSIPVGHEKRWREVEDLYLKATEQFAKLDVYGCKVARIALMGPRTSEAKGIYPEAYIDRIVSSDGRLITKPRSDC